MWTLVRGIGRKIDRTSGRDMTRVCGKGREMCSRYLYTACGRGEVPEILNFIYPVVEMNPLLAQRLNHTRNISELCSSCIKVDIYVFYM